MYNLVSLAGVFLLMIFAWLFSTDRRVVNWRVVVWGTAMMFIFALCGFAYIASLAIFVGGTAALVPERTKDLSAVGPRALVAATLACLMTAAVAGVFFTEGSILFGK